MQRPLLLTAVLCACGGGGGPWTVGGGIVNPGAARTPPSPPDPPRVHPLSQVDWSSPTLNLSLLTTSQIKSATWQDIERVQVGVWVTADGPFLAELPFEPCMSLPPRLVESVKHLSYLHALTCAANNTQLMAAVQHRVSTEFEDVKWVGEMGKGKLMDPEQPCRAGFGVFCNQEKFAKDYPKCCPKQSPIGAIPIVALSLTILGLSFAVARFWLKNRAQRRRIDATVRTVENSEAVRMEAGTTHFSPPTDFSPGGMAALSPFQTELSQRVDYTVRKSRGRSRVFVTTPGPFDLHVATAIGVGLTNLFAVVTIRHRFSEFLQQTVVKQNLTVTPNNVEGVVRDVVEVWKGRNDRLAIFLQKVPTFTECDTTALRTLIDLAAIQNLTVFIMVQDAVQGNELLAMANHAEQFPVPYSASLIPTMFDAWGAQQPPRVKGAMEFGATIRHCCNLAFLFREKSLNDDAVLQGQAFRSYPGSTTILQLEDTTPPAAAMKEVLGVCLGPQGNYPEYDSPERGIKYKPLTAATQPVALPPARKLSVFPSGGAAGAVETAQKAATAARRSATAPVTPAMDYTSAGAL